MRNDSIKFFLFFFSLYVLFSLITFHNISVSAVINDDRCWLILSLVIILELHAFCTVIIVIIIYIQAKSANKISLLQCNTILFTQECYDAYSERFVITIHHNLHDSYHHRAFSYVKVITKYMQI